MEFVAISSKGRRNRELCGRHIRRKKSTTWLPDPSQPSLRLRCRLCLKFRPRGVYLLLARRLARPSMHRPYPPTPTSRVCFHFFKPSLQEKSSTTDWSRISTQHTYRPNTHNYSVALMSLFPTHPNITLVIQPVFFAIPSSRTPSRLAVPPEQQIPQYAQTHVSVHYFGLGIMADPQ